MQNSIITIIIMGALTLAGTTSILANAYALTESIKCQSGALITYVGTIFGLANVCTDGYTINVDTASNYMPESGKVFEAWLVDDASSGSGYESVWVRSYNLGHLDFMRQ